MRALSPLLLWEPDIDTEAEEDAMVLRVWIEPSQLLCCWVFCLVVVVVAAVAAAGQEELGESLDKEDVVELEDGVVVLLSTIV